MAAIGHQDHDEHHSMLECAGGEFDPDAFDPTEFGERFELEQVVAR